MSRLLQWVLGVSAALVALSFAFRAALPLFAARLGVEGGAWMMGPGHRFSHGAIGPGMMFGGRMGAFGMPFLGVGMFFGPLLLIGLVVLGVFVLARWRSQPAGPGQAAPPPAATAPCTNCGRPLQPEWVACPFCGERVKRET